MRIAFVLLVALAGMATPTVADAKLRTLKLRYGPIAVSGYAVKYGRSRVPAPRVDGFITRMHARTVDAKGRPVPESALMLHHVAFLDLGRRGHPKRDGTYCPDSPGRRFYGTGEEDQTLVMPAGYGYHVRRHDRWDAAWMYMNHKLRGGRAYLEYEVTIDDDPHLVPVTPYWVGVVPCTTDPIFDVPGGEPPGSVTVQSGTWTVPRDGRIVAAGGHLHGGARNMALREPACDDRRLVQSSPLYGFADNLVYHVLPVLHEPGPISMSWTTSRLGIPIRSGDTLRLDALYDASEMHVRAMGILHVYVAPPARRRADWPRCSPLPGDVEEQLQKDAGRTEPPSVTVPLTGLDRAGRARPIDRPPGATVTRTAREVVVKVAGFRLSPANLSVRRGTVVRWWFPGRTRHDVTVANGPVGFSSPPLGRGGGFQRRLERPGVYKLFCSLHPVTMTQTVTVR